MKSVMSHDFATTPKIDAPRSVFDMSFGHKTDFNAGWLIPLYHQEVLPGDTLNVNMTVFCRMATPLFPIMDNQVLESQFFFVPYRLLWDNWRKFCGEQTDPNDSIDYTIPKLEGVLASDCEGDLTTDNGRCQRLMDYLGVPDTIAPDNVDISAFPFRAYSRIYNEWYRDQNLINSDDPGMLTGDAADDIDTAGGRHRLQRRGKRRDYFTQALPWPQKGDAVSLPIGSSAPVLGIGPSSQVYTGTTDFYQSDGTTYTTDDVATATLKMSEGTTGYPAIYADLSSATASTINDIREAFQIQRLLERDARSGTRYPEVIKNHFNVDFYDVSYRPEYLGGGRTNVSINPVATTANSAVNSEYAGDMAAFATIGGSGHGFNKTFVEHGIVMGIISVRADLTYQQGLNRFFSHSTRYDKYWPSLAHLGEQAVLNKEIYCQGVTGTSADDGVFGYVPRYDEYRHNPSMITGSLRSSAATSLDAWHLSQEFSSLPTLGQTFIEENPPLDRTLAVAESHYILDSYISVRAARPIPTFGTPGMMDHF